MLRFLSVRLAAAAAAAYTRTDVEKYLDHLNLSDEDLPVLTELLPNKRSSKEDVRQFQRLLIEIMEENNHKCIGMKIVPASSDSMRPFRALEAICTPIFSNARGRQTFAVKQQRIQHVEPAIAIPIVSDELPLSPETAGDHGKGTTQLVPSSTINKGEWTDSILPSPPALLSGTTGLKLMQRTAELCPFFEAAVEVTGSRFPFFPSSANGFASDMGSCVGIVLAEDEQPAVAAASNKPNNNSNNNRGRCSVAGGAHLGWQEVKLVASPGGLAMHPFVLTRDEEPVQVGVPRNCNILEDSVERKPLSHGVTLTSGRGPANDTSRVVFGSVAYAAAYAAAIGRPLARGDVVLLSGVSGRVPAIPGVYKVNYGPYGSVSCTLEE